MIIQRINILLLTMSLSSCHTILADEFVRIGWKQAGILPADKEGKMHPGLAGPVVGMHNNLMMIGGGANFPDAMPWEGGKKVYHSRIYLYKKVSDDSLILVHSKNILPESLAYPAVVSTPMGIVIAGGENSGGPTNKVWLSSIRTVDRSVSFLDLPSLPQPVTNAAMASMDNDIYLAGGESLEGPQSSVWKLNLDDTAAGWHPLPSLPVNVSHAVLTVIETAEGLRLFIAGGRCKQPDGISIHYDKVYSLKIDDHNWQPREPLPYPISAATGATGPTGEWIIFGGDKGIVFEQVERLLRQIANESDSTLRNKWIKEKNNLQSAHPGFSKAVWVYDFITDSWTEGDNIPYDAPATTTAVKWGKAIYLPCGEIKAGVRTPAILKAEVID